MTMDEAKRRALSYAAFLTVAGLAWWGLTRGVPRWRKVEAVRLHRVRVEAMTRDARSQAVRSGGPALEDSIALARARFALVQTLVPEVGTGEGDGDVRRLVAALAERTGVVVRLVEEGPAAREGALFVSSARVSAAGRYHDLGAWISGVEAARRLVQVTDVAIGREADGATHRPDEPAPVLRPEDTVVLQATFRWFRQESPAARQDSTKGRN